MRKIKCYTQTTCISSFPCQKHLQSFKTSAGKLKRSCTHKEHTVFTLWQHFILKKTSKSRKSEKKIKDYNYADSLISAFVVRCLDSIIRLLASRNFKPVALVSVADQASLSLTWSQHRRQIFSWRGSYMGVEQQHKLSAMIKNENQDEDWFYYKLL